MTAGHVGDEVRPRPTQAYGGHPVPFESRPLRADGIDALLDRAGLALAARLSEEPAEGAKRTITTFPAQKPGQRRGSPAVSPWRKNTGHTRSMENPEACDRMTGT